MNSEAKDRVCAEIVSIMATYHEQEEAGYIDTPGGLEHMGDVWSLLGKWERALTAARIDSSDSESQ